MEQVLVELKDVKVAFDGEPVLKGIDLEIKDKEFITLLGPSGCGKTTTLRIIGGFVTPDSGDLLFEGKQINKLPPHKRNVNTVFQKYALFPHMNVAENVAFGLKIKKENPQVIRNQVREMLALVGLSGFEHRKVTNLSGGQQQRVAIARALVNRPRVLLLDEPLGALDLKLRKEMQLELKKIQRETNITFIYVTHDQEEALTMSDRVVVMRDGQIQQIGTPQDIYNEPVNAFVADFIGESNIVDGIMYEDFDVEFAGAEFVCVDKGFAPKEIVDVVIRPEDIEVVPVDDGKISGVVESVIFKGVHYEMQVNACGMTWLIHSTKQEKVGDVIGMNIAPENIHIMHKNATGYKMPEELDERALADQKDASFEEVAQ